MTCLDVRDRLSELVLGLLTPPEAREIDRHLDWCPGCRKEADELRDGAASVAMALVGAEPSPALEELVVDRVKDAAAPRASGSRRGFRILAIATFAAALLAVGAVAWGVKESNRANDQQQSFDHRVAQLRELVSVAGSLQAKLLATTSSADEGQAVVYSSPRSSDFVFVDVFPSQPVAGPYRFKLFDRSGRVISGGTLRGTTNGDFLFYEFSGRDLSRAASATVFNGPGDAVLVGRFRPNHSG